MADNLIPLQALARNPRRNFADIQEQQLNIQNLERQGQMQDLQIQDAQRKQQDQVKIKQVLGAGLPDDQTIQQLKMSGLPDVAFAYEKAAAERNKTIAETTKEQRAQHEADLQQTGQFINGLLANTQEGSPERQSAWERYRATHPQAAKMSPEPPSDLDGKMILAESMKTLDQIKTENDKAGESRAQAEEQRKIEEANKPAAFGTAFQNPQGEQIQPLFRKNAAGQWEITSQNFGQAQPRRTTTGLQSKELAGPSGPIQANFDPATGKYFDATGKEISNPRPYIKPENGTARSDRSYGLESKNLDTLEKPISDTTARLGRLQDTLNQNTPQADALIAPELLSVMAGGVGSGVRMNEAEIARIVGGRSNWETLKAAANKWSLDPASARGITPAQQQQIRDLVRTVSNKLLSKQTVLQGARQALIGTDDPAEQRKITADTRKKLLEIDSGGATAGVIRVIINGSIGEIPAAQLDAARKKYPKLQVIQ